jgi:hypothetical protein
MPAHLLNWALRRAASNKSISTPARRAAARINAFTAALLDFSPPAVGRSPEKRTERGPVPNFSATFSAILRIGVRSTSA